MGGSSGAKTSGPSLHSRAVGVRPPLVSMVAAGVSALIALAAIIAPEARARPRDSGVNLTHVFLARHTCRVQVAPTVAARPASWRSTGAGRRRRQGPRGHLRLRPKKRVAAPLEANVACNCPVPRSWSGGGEAWEAVSSRMCPCLRQAQDACCGSGCVRADVLRTLRVPPRAWPQILTVTSTGAPGPPGPRGDLAQAGGQGPPGRGDLRGHPVRLDRRRDRCQRRNRREAGPLGATGAQGPQGIQGATGPQGPIGDRGRAVRQGVQGMRSCRPQGPIGDAGPTGATRCAGGQGIRGRRARRGPIGEHRGRRGRPVRRGVRGSGGDRPAGADW